MLITSNENINVKQYVRLSTSKKARDEHNQFTLEGSRLLKDAVSEKSDIQTIFATETAFERDREFLSEYSDKIILVSEGVAKRLSNTKSDQGIFAIVNKPENKLLSNCTLSGKFVVLNNIQDPGNLGTILRTADAMGVSGVILCENCCDLYNPKVVRSTMGSLFRLKIYIENDFDGVLSRFRLEGVKTYAAVVSKQATEIRSVKFPLNSAIVIGNEGNGLKREHSALCDEQVTIEMNGNIDSLNASVAAAILMWEMTKT